MWPDSPILAQDALHSFDITFVRACFSAPKQMHHCWSISPINVRLHKNRLFFVVLLDMLKLENYSLVEFTLRRRTRVVPYGSIQWATSSIYLLHCSISLCSQSLHQRFMSLWSTLTTYDGLEFDLLPILHYKKKKKHSASPSSGS